MRIAFFAIGFIPRGDAESWPMIKHEQIARQILRYAVPVRMTDIEPTLTRWTTNIDLFHWPWNTQRQSSQLFSSIHAPASNIMP
jgi:hypothetical protein